jgi:hypothetical protein
LRASEFPSPNTEGTRGIVTAQIEANRAKVVVVHNSRIYIGTILLISLGAAFISISSVLVVVSQIFPFSALTVARGMSAAQWAFGAFFFAFMCSFMWTMAKKLAFCGAKLDSSGVQFNLGSKRAPVRVFLPWDKIVAVQQQRVGNLIQFTVRTADGTYARYSSYTFLRPKKVARLIAERTGIAIQKI